MINLKKIAAKLSLITLVGVMLFSILAPTVSAQTNIYKVLQTPFYDPGSGGSSCSSSAGGTNAGIVWPFATKSTDQYERVDQGWDIQSTTGAAVYAVAPGTIHVYAPDNGGFGNDYPTEKLDASIGGPSDWVYYGHVHVLPSVIDQHVDAGQQIATANTTDPQNGSQAPTGWLEIGFAQPGTDAPIDKAPESVATAAGQKMKDLLINAQPGAAAIASGSTSSLCCSSTSSSLTGAQNEDKVWNYFISKNFSPIQASAIMGNLQSESAGTWNPRVIQGDPPTFGDSPVRGKGYGLAQWTTDSRQQTLVDRAKIAGVIAGDLGVQLDYIWWELNEGPYKSVGDQLKNISDLQTATYLILVSYESPAHIEANKPARLNNATAILSKYGSDVSATRSASGSGDCGSSGAVNLDTNFSMIKLSPPMNTPGEQIIPKGITLHWWGDSTHGQSIDTLVSALKGNGGCTGGCSVQIGITADGKVYQMTNSLTDKTYHAVGANETTIGIEIGGTTEDFGQAGIDKYPAKFNAVVNTVKYLMNKYNIPADGQVVCGDVIGVHPHKAYNQCLFNGLPQNKSDIDDVYFNAVMQKVKAG